MRRSQLGLAIASGVGMAAGIAWLARSRSKPRGADGPLSQDDHDRLGPQDADDDRLQRLRETYDEVLAATKHEDSKIGRFLAALAFIVAGALLFIQQDVLRAEYILGNVSLRLPAIFLVLFVATATLAVLAYVNATAARLTEPPAASDDEPDDPVRSHLFFSLIARESADSWKMFWQPQWASRERFLHEYRRETLNLARRAYNKRLRSLEASSLFVVALLFFGVSVGFAIHVLSQPDSTTASPLAWSVPVRLGLAAGLVAFQAVVVYHLRRFRQVDDPGERNVRGLYLGLGGSSVYIVANLLPAGWTVASHRYGMAALAAAGAVVAAAGFVSSRLPARTPRVAPAMTVAALVAAATGGSVLVVASGEVAWQLLLAAAATLSPLVGTALDAYDETRDRRERFEELERWVDEQGASRRSAPRTIADR